jgi:tryptophan synthase alpha chain
MKRIEKLFSGKRNNVLNVYCTAGFPQLQSSLQVLRSLEKNGADMVELGMPYSDPLADGAVIQHSSAIALQNGMTIKKLFEQLKDLRKNPSAGGVGGDLPVILMGYMNPVFQFGFEKFCAEAAAAGIDGLIIPDLPEWEFETEYGPIINKYGLDFIFLVTPETSEERVKKLDQLSNGFLYAVSSSSTTGSEKNMENVKTYLERLKNLRLKNPILVGFGISDKQSFDSACRSANGAIIGSAYIKALENAKDIEAATKSFLGLILAAKNQQP